MSILTITEYSNDIVTVIEKELVVEIADFDTGTGSIPLSNLTAKGVLVTASAANTPSALAPGTDGQFLVADAASAGGLKWSTPTYNAQYYQFVVIAYGTNVSTGDGKYYFVVPPHLDGLNLTFVHANHITAGTGATLFAMQVANVTDSVDMLSTKVTIDASELGSETAAAPCVIDATKDDVAAYDLLRIDVDAVQNTVVGKGLIVTLGFG